MRKIPHMSSISKPYLSTSKNYKSLDKLGTYQNDTVVSSISNVEGIVTWKSTYSSGEPEKTATFEIDINKIASENKNLRLNQKKGEGRIISTDLKNIP